MRNNLKELNYVGNCFATKIFRLNLQMPRFAEKNPFYSSELYSSDKKQMHLGTQNGPRLRRFVQFLRKLANSIAKVP